MGRFEPFHKAAGYDRYLREADPRHEAANLTDANCRNPQGGRRNRDRLIALILIQGPGACSVDSALVAETFGGL